MSSTRKQRVLAFGAHPDDVEIFCLGLLLQLQQRGWEISWVIATDGQAGLPEDAVAGNTVTGIRRDEALKAGALAGVAPVLLGLEDGKLIDGPTEAALVRNAIAAFEPDLIIGPATNDYHPDHRALARMVDAACPVRTAQLVCDTMLGIDFLPEFSVDITSVFSRKLACLEAHVSQKPELLLPAITTWNAFRALQTTQRSIKQAEAYRTVRGVGRPSPFALLEGLAI